MPAEGGDFVGAGRPGFEACQFLADRLEAAAVDDLVAERGFKKILAARIPAAKDELIEAGQPVGFLELFGDQRLWSGVAAPHQRDTGHQG